MIMKIFCYEFEDFFQYFYGIVTILQHTHQA